MQLSVQVVSVLLRLKYMQDLVLQLRLMTLILIKILDFLTYKDSSVKEAIKDADIISLHVPANKEKLSFIR